MREEISKSAQTNRPPPELRFRRRSSDFCNCKVVARIPHQSKIGSEEPIFASFPPGEAMGAAAPDELLSVIVMGTLVIIERAQPVTIPSIKGRTNLVSENPRDCHVGLCPPRNDVFFFTCFFSRTGKGGKHCGLFRHLLLTFPAISYICILMKVGVSRAY